MRVPRGVKDLKLGPTNGYRLQDPEKRERQRLLQGVRNALKKRLLEQFQERDALKGLKSDKRGPLNEPNKESQGLERVYNFGGKRFNNGVKQRLQDLDRLENASQNLEEPALKEAVNKALQDF